MQAPRTILVVEDEADMARLLRHNLSERGYSVLLAANGERGLALAKSHLPDLILLDLGLPGLSGLNVLQELKENRATAALPVLIVSAHGSEDDIVLGLNLGADDYITKPFGMRELLARIAATLRRGESTEEEDDTLTAGDAVVNFSRHEVIIAGKEVHLTPSEFAIFAQLARRPGRVFTRRQLCDRALRAGESVQERAIDAHIRTLRRKLGKAGKRIVTVWGVGYKFSEA